MSTAEITAHRIYETYKLGALPQEVKRQLMILFLSETPYQDITSADENNSMAGEIEELQTRGRIAMEQINAKEGKPIDELFDEINSQHPWLCK